jgi:hypothetical protein
MIVARIVVILSIFIGSGFGQATITPSIKFSRVPPKNPGGPLTMGVITGQHDCAQIGAKLKVLSSAGAVYASQPASPLSLKRRPNFRDGWRRYIFQEPIRLESERRKLTG